MPVGMSSTDYEIQEYTSGYWLQRLTDSCALELQQLLKLEITQGSINHTLSYTQKQWQWLNNGYQRSWSSLVNFEV